MKNLGKDWQSAAAAALTFPPFSLRSNADVLYADEKVVPLEPNAVRVLRFLVENRDRVVGKQELLDTVWRDVFTTEDVLKKAVSQIRRTLKDDLREPKYIETHHRRGYRFIAEVALKSSADGDATALPAVENAAQPLGEIAADETFLQTLDADFNQFVGRETEIELLRGEFRRVLNDGGGQPILIVGEPGIGKTQLSARFEDWAKAAHEAVCLRARFYDYEAARISASDLFVDLLKESFVRLNETTEIAADKNADLHSLAEKLEIKLPAEIFRLGDKSQTENADAQRIIAPLAECFMRVSRIRPLVLIFDDLQWADDLSRRIIGYLMRAGASEKLMIVALARREECENAAHDFAAWLNAQAAFRSFSVVSLQPLTENDYDKLLRQAFGLRLDTATIPYDESNLIYRTTGGNPYFLIETLRMLLAENVVEKIADGDSNVGWKWRGLSDVPLPETIRMAARGKLNRLSAKTRDYVEHAAIFGDAFYVETLHEMFGGETSDGETELETCLSEAIASQVLTEQNVSGTDNCQFYHTTLRRAVYADLSPRRRKRLHLRAARAIEKIHADEPERVAASLSVHYEAAGEPLSSFERALTAAAHARKRFDWREAAECAARANRAAETLDKNETTKLSDENKLRLLLATGEAIMSTGRREEAEKTLEQAAVLARELGDEVSLAAARAVQGHARVLLGRYREALASSTEALELSLKLNDDEGVAEALLQIGSAQYTLGDFNLACETLQKVIDEKRSGDYRKAVALGKIGWVRALQGRYKAGKILLEQALAFHKTAGDVRQRIVLSLCLNWCEYGLGKYESAVAYATEAARQAHQNLGESFSEAVAAVRIGRARIAQGLYAEAETVLSQTLAKMKNGGGSVHCEAETVWFLGRAKIAQNQTEAAEKLLDRALAAIRRIGDREDEFNILIDVAELKILQNDLPKALENAENAVAIARELEIADGIGLALIAKTNALFKLKNFAEARHAIESAIELLETAESGERWRAYFTLAEVLRADAQDKKAASNAHSKNNKNLSNANESEAIEAALRQSLEFLAEIHAQFEISDAVRSNVFLQTHRQPARRLCELLENSDRRTEAVEIRRVWHIA